MGDRLGIRDAVGITLLRVAHLKLTHSTRLYLVLKRLAHYRSVFKTILGIYFIIKFNNVSDTSKL